MAFASLMPNQRLEPTRPMFKGMTTSIHQPRGLGAIR